MAKSQDESIGSLIKGLEVVEKVTDKLSDRVLINTVWIRVIVTVGSLLLSLGALIKVYELIF